MPAASKHNLRWSRRRNRELLRGATVKIELSRSAVLVPFECLSRFSDTDEPGIVEPGEQRVLWSVCYALE